MSKSKTWSSCSLANKQFECIFVRDLDGWASFLNEWLSRTQLRQCTKPPRLKDAIEWHAVQWPALEWKPAQRVHSDILSLFFEIFAVFVFVFYEQNCRFEVTTHIRRFECTVRFIRDCENKCVYILNMGVQHATEAANMLQSSVKG